MKRYAHQIDTKNKLAGLRHAFIASDPGTGKTCCIIDDYTEHRFKNNYGRALILAPLSILEPSWGDDIEKFSPNTEWAIAHGKTKHTAFISSADIVIMNHDAVKWLADNMHLLDGFNYICVDESTVFKHRGSQRSRAMKKVIQKFEHRRLMTGTPNPNTVLDLWHQIYLLDNGARLGSQFYRFRSQVCEPKQIGPHPNHVQWSDKSGAEAMVADAIRDITIRYKFENCVDVPEHTKRYMYIDIPVSLRRTYEEFNYNAQIQSQQGVINAVHAGSKVKKLLQILSGCVYDENGEIHKIHNERHQLVISLVEERQASIVAFNWRHEREELCKLADKKGITYGVIDGETPPHERTEIVKRFQAGELQTVFAHPQSAGHGLTLTRGTATIWCSPTYNAEHFQQFNRRIYRAGQTKKTETICIAAKRTKEVGVYEKLDGKLTRMEDILAIFADITRIKKAS